MSERWADDAPRVGRLRKPRRVPIHRSVETTSEAGTPRPQTPPPSLRNEGDLLSSSEPTSGCGTKKKSSTAIQAGKESRQAKSAAIRWEKRIQLLSLQLYKVRTEKEVQTRARSSRKAAAAALSSEELFIQRRSREQQQKLHLRSEVTQAKLLQKQNIAKARMKLINSKKMAREVRLLIY